MVRNLCGNRLERAQLAISVSISIDVTQAAVPISASSQGTVVVDAPSDNPLS